MEYGIVVPAINKVIEQYTMRLTVRQIYYRLVASLVIPNTRTAYKTFDKIIVRAREKGHVNWRRIEDRSRQVLGYGDWGFDNIKEFLEYQIERLKESGDNYTKPLWETQDNTVIVVLEKDALSRLFTEVADPFRVKVYPTRGYGSFTYLKNLSETLDGEKPTTVLYFGDYDPSGRDIERDLGDRLDAYGAEEFEVYRVAITPEQIAEYNLPPRPEDAETLAKLARDPRTKTYGAEYAVELDAIEPNTLQDLIRKAIENQIDMTEWETRQEEIDEELEEVKRKLKTVKVTFEEER